MKQAPLERTRAEDSFSFPVCCVKLPTSRDTRVAVRAFHQKEDDEERERRCDDAIAIDEGKADVVMLLRMFCGTTSSTWQFLSFGVVDTIPILCIHSELDTWYTHSCSCQSLSVNFWEHYKAYGEHHHKTLNYGEHIKTFDPRMHHPFGLDSQNLFISISLLMTENLRTISNDCLHMFSILLLSLKLKLATQLGDHEVIGRLSCRTVGECQLLECIQHDVMTQDNWGVTALGSNHAEQLGSVNLEHIQREYKRAVRRT